MSSAMGRLSDEGAVHEATSIEAKEIVTFACNACISVGKCVPHGLICDLVELGRSAGECLTAFCCHGERA
jgi:hypothetical protein